MRFQRYWRYDPVIKEIVFAGYGLGYREWDDKERDVLRIRIKPKFKFELVFKNLVKYFK